MRRQRRRPGAPPARAGQAPSAGGRRDAGAGSEAPHTPAPRDAGHAPAAAPGHARDAPAPAHPAVGHPAVGPRSPELRAPDARRERTRRELLDAARDVFARKGYAGANVEDFVAGAGVARGTFYLYFRDKRDVYAALVDDLFARIAAEVRSIDVAHPTLPPVEQLRANLARIAALASTHPALLTLVLRDTGSLDPELRRKLDGFYAALHTFLDESLQVGQRIGLVRDGDRRALVRIALGGLKELLAAAAAGELGAAPDTLADEMMRFLATGLLAPPPASAPPRR